MRGNNKVLVLSAAYPHNRFEGVGPEALWVQVRVRMSEQRADQQKNTIQ
jgi:hypothetical protein